MSLKGAFGKALWDSERSRKLLPGARSSVANRAAQMQQQLLRKAGWGLKILIPTEVITALGQKEHRENQLRARFKVFFALTSLGFRCNPRLGEQIIQQEGGRRRQQTCGCLWHVQWAPAWSASSALSSYQHERQEVLAGSACSALSSYQHKHFITADTLIC